MRLEDLSPEQIEQAKRCETPEERMAFITGNDIDLTDEQMDAIAGGKRSDTRGCRESPTFQHNFKPTGKTRPGSVLRNLWPDKEERCTYCGKVKWVY